MEFLTGGRQNGQTIHNALKLYKDILSLPSNTVIRIIKKDGKHSGIVTKIEPVIENGEYDFKISINEGREYKEYTDSIHNFIIF